MTNSINGHDIITSDEQIKCRFGPDETTGKYVESTISRQKYELMCKNAGSDFCQCDVMDRESLS